MKILLKILIVLSACGFSLVSPGQENHEIFKSQTEVVFLHGTSFEAYCASDLSRKVSEHISNNNLRPLNSNDLPGTAGFANQKGEVIFLFDSIKSCIEQCRDMKKKNDFGKVDCTAVYVWK